MLGKVQRDRKEIDVFPTRYRVNAVWRLRAELRKVGFEAVVYGYEAEPSYLQFSAIAYGFGKLLHSLTPPPLRTCSAEADGALQSKKTFGCHLTTYSFTPILKPIVAPSRSSEEGG